MLIAADVGGTKTLIGLYSTEQGARRPLAEARLRSAAYPGLEALVRAFLHSVNLQAECGCFAVPGPVVGGSARLTNLPWKVDEEALASGLGLHRVRLLNDLEATAYAVPHLESSELQVLNHGTPQPRGPVAVIAPGTGLGEAFLLRGGTDVIVCASEGGHSAFAPTNETELDLLRHFRARHGHVTYELVCSGPGLASIFDCLTQAGDEPVAPQLAARLAGVADRAPLIIEAAMTTSPPDRLCLAAVRAFVGVLGVESANLALKVLSTGGIYVGGGIPPRILPVLEDGTFMRAFVRGKLSDLLSRIPVHVILSPAAMLGAAWYGLDHLPQPTEPRDHEGK